MGVAACRALIVDDDADMRVLLRLTLERTTTIVGESVGGDDAVTQWRETRPDIVVLDHRMPGRSGLDVAEEILGEDPDQAIVLFSAWLDRATETQAEQLGIRECVSKDEVRDLPRRLLQYGPGV